MMGIFTKATLIAGVPLLLLVGARAQQPPVAIVRAESTVAKDRIELGAISDIIGEGPVVDKARLVSMGLAPALGSARTISREQLILALNSAGFTQRDLTLRSPDVVIVRRSGQVIDPKDVRSVVESYVRGLFEAGVVELRFAKIDVPGEIQVPAGVFDIRVDTSNVRSIFSRFAVPVQLRVDGTNVRTIVATVELEAFADVLVAARDLPANTPLTADDVRAERVRVTRPYSVYATDPALLNGVSTTGSLRVGEPITRDKYFLTNVIKPGDPVRVEAAAGPLKLMINGEALTAGRVGDRIAVRNKGSGSIIKAIVLGQGRVFVSL